MFSWLKRKKSDTNEHELEETQVPKIRKPTHAARDARMSIPVGKREYYEILEARKRVNVGQPSVGTSAMKGMGKGKARSPLAYVDSGECFHLLRDRSNLTFGIKGLPSSSASPAFSVTTSYTSSYGYDADMGGFWESAAGVSRRHSTAQTSLTDSSREAAAKSEVKAKKSGIGNVSA